MKIARNYDCAALPAWGGLKEYKRFTIKRGNPLVYKSKYKKNTVVILNGACRVVENGVATILSQYQKYSFGDDKILIEAINGFDDPMAAPFYFTDYVDMMILGGTWISADVNIFAVAKSDQPKNIGTETSYYRNTVFDNHYHDFDEYWIFYDGTGVVQTEGNFVEMEEGDCVATGAGHHHDLPIIHCNMLKAIAIETEPMGRMRHGHLWEHRDGKATPDLERV